MIDGKLPHSVKNFYYTGGIGVHKVQQTKAVDNISKSDDSHGEHTRLFGATVPVLIRAYVPRGPVSRSSRPQAHSSSPEEINTHDDVSVDTYDVFKVTTAEGNEQATSISLTGRKRKQHEAAERKQTIYT